jgi:hypothetical protein
MGGGMETAASAGFKKANAKTTKQAGQDAQAILKEIISRTNARR